MGKSDDGCGLPGFFAVIGALAGAGLASNSGGDDDQIMGGLIGGAILGLIVCGIVLAAIDLAKKLIAIVVSLIIGCVSLLIWTSRAASVAEVLSSSNGSKPPPKAAPVDPAPAVRPVPPLSSSRTPTYRWNIPPAPKSTPPSSSSFSPGRDFYLINRCSVKVEFLLRYKNLDSRWLTLGWWSYDAGERSHLAHDGQRIQSSNNIFYYYAHAPGPNLSWIGDSDHWYKGRKYAMRQAQLAPNERGAWELDLHCDNYEPPRLFFKNSCARSLNLLLLYRGLDEEWTTAGWWSVDGNKGTYLLDDGERVRSTSSIFYWYAHMPGYEWAGDIVRTFEGREYKMRKAKLQVDADGDWLLEAGCDNL